MGSSSTMPAQSPGANWVSPMYAIWPGLVPPTHTRSPIMKLSVSSVNTTLWSGMIDHQVAGCAPALTECGAGRALEGCGRWGARWAGGGGALFKFKLNKHQATENAMYLKSNLALQFVT